jgi:hypothetical protein
MSDIRTEVRGLNELSARLDAMDPSLQSRLRIFFAAFTIRLRDQVKANIAAIFRSTGPLYQSVQAEIEEEPGAITGRVFTQGVPYAKIQEEGGVTSPHIILPKTASVLAFMDPGGAGGGPGGLVFAKRVNHPGSNIPARPYATTALAMMRGEFEGGIRGVVAEATGAFAMAAE